MFTQCVIDGKAYASITPDGTVVACSLSWMRNARVEDLAAGARSKLWVDRAAAHPLVDRRSEVGADARHRCCVDIGRQRDVARGAGDGGGDRDDTVRIGGNRRDV